MLAPLRYMSLPAVLIAGHFGEALTADAWRRIAKKRNKYPQFDSLRVFMRRPATAMFPASSNATEGK